jgi:uncharacterized protein (DUF433 family)
MLRCHGPGAKMTQPISTHTDEETAIMRTARGLTITGTRITLYDVFDCLMAEWPAHLIRERLNLTQEQTDAAIDYITAHREIVEDEYRQILQNAEDSRRYWDAYNQERFNRVASLPPRPDQAELRAKLADWKKKQQEP